MLNHDDVRKGFDCVQQKVQLTQNNVVIDSEKVGSWIRIVLS